MLVFFAKALSYEFIFTNTDVFEREHSGLLWCLSFYYLKIKMLSEV